MQERGQRQTLLNMIMELPVPEEIEMYWPTDIM
jgi:hypothetical protein